MANPPQQIEEQPLIAHDILVPPAQRLQKHPTNFIFDADRFKCPHLAIVEILRRHPLYRTLTITADAPEIYIQEFWHSIRYNDSGRVHRFHVTLNHQEITFSLAEFRQILQLPARTEFPGRQQFETVTSEAELRDDIRRLGYSVELDKVSAFKRKHLPQMWGVLFTIMNRCLTCKATGMDSGSLALLRMFQGIIFNHHYNYALLIWNDLVEMVEDKNTNKARSFIPMLRFTKVLINAFLQQHPEIPKRVNEPTIEDSMMRYTRADCGDPNIPAMRIPEPLLAIADQEAESVKAYRELFPPMVQLESAEPVEGPPIGQEGEGPRVLGEEGHESGDSDRRESERGASEEEKNAPDEHGECNGESAHALPVHHSDVIGIETEEHVFESSTLVQTLLSLNPNQTFLRTRELDAGVCANVGTAIVTSSIDVSQGLAGSSTTANITPTVNGHTAPILSGSTIVLTERLSGSGVTMEFVSREYFDEALKNVRASFREEMATMRSSFEEQLNHVKRSYKGKDAAPILSSSSTPLPQPPLQPDFSIEELKNILLAKLMSTTTTTPENVSLLEMLQRKADNATNSATQSDILAAQTHIDAQIDTSEKNLMGEIQLVKERVMVLEETCNLHARGQKRKHDD